MTIQHTCPGCGKPMQVQASDDCPSSTLRFLIHCLRCDACVQPVAEPSEKVATNLVPLHETALRANTSSHERKESFAGSKARG